MTVLGIAGCTALLVTGFGIKDSIQMIVSGQYGEILKYDMQAALLHTQYHPTTKLTGETGYQSLKGQINTHNVN